MRLSRLPSASAPGHATLEASQCFSARQCGSAHAPVQLQHLLLDERDAVLRAVQLVAVRREVSTHRAALLL
eukprot:354094-Chlamydomonas_euryale.AAC.4